MSPSPLFIYICARPTLPKGVSIRDFSLSKMHLLFVYVVMILSRLVASPASTSYSPFPSSRPSGLIPNYAKRASVSSSATGTMPFKKCSSSLNCFDKCVRRAVTSMSTSIHASYAPRPSRDENLAKRKQAFLVNFKTSLQASTTSRALCRTWTWWSLSALGWVSHVP